MPRPVSGRDLFSHEVAQELDTLLFGPASLYGALQLQVRNGTGKLKAQRFRHGLIVVEILDGAAQVRFLPIERQNCEAPLSPCADVEAAIRLPVAHFFD